MRGDERARVAITGMGVKAPGGRTTSELWDTVRAGRSAAGPVQNFDASDLSVRFACEVRDFDPTEYLGPKESRRVDRVTQLGFAAAMDAFRDAGEPRIDPARAAVVAGTGIGGLSTLEEQVHVYRDKGPERVSPFFVTMMMPNATAGIIGINLGWTGPNLCIATACASGTNALGEGARLIREGSADMVMAGGAECAVTQSAVAAFARMGALSKRNEEPERASRPFDQDRDGFVLGEGAAFMVLERWEVANERGARILGELAGYGRTSDAHHITAPAPGGSGAAAAMQLALDDAGQAAGAITQINAHGTSTPLNDQAESEAICKVFGHPTPPVTSTKGSIGHLLGAAGAVEAVVALMSAREGLVPPTANLEQVAAGIALDAVSGERRPVAVGPVLSNSFAFGGHNASLVLVPA